jgi:SAM-dependent methyltransferase
MAKQKNQAHHRSRKRGSAGAGPGRAAASKRLTQAERSDRHELYQESVQSPEADVEFFNDRFKELRRRKPKILREDFCGTALLSCTWAKQSPNHRAIGIDLDQATLDWGLEHNLSRLDKGGRRRVELHCANVLDGVGERADLVCAMNFSYCVFKTRAELERYFRSVLDRLVDDGVFILELYGGFEAIQEHQDERECEGFTYVWQQRFYNPINHETVCHIHFEFDDGSEIRRAFTYDWRLWTIPEIREVLAEVGFSATHVYWEEVDEDGDGTGEYSQKEVEENAESWVVYIVAAK